MLKGHKPLGLAIGLAGNVLLGTVLFMVLDEGECGRRAGHSCASGTGWWALLIPAGAIVSFVGMLLGGYVVSLVGIFLAVGFGTLAATLFGDVGPGPVFGWLFGLAFVVMGIGLAILFARVRDPKAEKAKRKQAWADKQKKA